MVNKELIRTVSIVGLIINILIFPVSLFLLYWSFTYINEGGWDTVNDSPDYLYALAMHEKDFFYSTLFLTINFIAIISSILLLFRKKNLNKLILWLFITFTITTIILFLLFLIKLL